MADSTTLYTTGPMRKAIFHFDPTSEATGFPKENMVDNNLDTVWKATSTSSQVFELDCGSTVSADAIILFIKNYDTISSGTYAIEGSANGSTYTGIDASIALTDTLGPMRITDFTSGAQSYRYWKVSIVVPSHVVELAACWIAQKHTLSVGNQIPENDSDRFINRSMQAAGGRQFVKGSSQESIRILPRTYMLVDGTTWTSTELYLAHQDSRGTRHPVIVQEGSVQTDALVCRFMSDELSKKQIDFNTYNPSVGFIEIPYIRAGESY